MLACLKNTIKQGFFLLTFLANIWAPPSPPRDFGEPRSAHFIHRASCEQRPRAEKNLALAPDFAWRLRASASQRLALAQDVKSGASARFCLARSANIIVRKRTMFARRGLPSSFLRAPSGLRASSLRARGRLASGPRAHQKLKGVMKP